MAAAGGLLLAATGCGGSASKAASKVCQALDSCDELDSEFDSMSECKEYYLEELEYYEEEYGKACGDAYADMLICAAKSYKKDCDYVDIYDDCEDEAEALYDECY